MVIALAIPREDAGENTCICVKSSNQKLALDTQAGIRSTKAIALVAALGSQALVLHRWVKLFIMKNFLFSLVFLCALCFTASAQTEVKAKDKKVKVETPHRETKVKKTTTPGQKVHNVIHPKHKRYSGVKVKSEAKKD